MRKSIWRLILSAAMGVGAPAWAGDFSISLKHIPSWDGAQLSAVVLVVIPSSWASPDLENAGSGAVLAGKGYVVVTYTS